jgi:hypothetical protein
LQKQEQNNYFFAILPGVLFALLAGGAILGFLWFGRRERFKPAKVDERGNILPMFDFVEGTATDIDNMPNYRGNLNETLKGLFMEYLRKKLELKPLLPEITAERQDEVKKRDQITDLATRAKLPLSLLKKLESPEMPALPALTESTEAETDAMNLPLPPWEFIRDWNGNRARWDLERRD